VGLASELTAHLMDGARQGWFRFDGPVRSRDGTRFPILVGAVWRRFDQAAAAAWLGGHALAREHPARPRTVTQAHLQREIALARAVLVNPSWVDSQRTAIRQVMQDTGATLSQLAERSGRTRKAVSAAIRYGQPRTLSNAMTQCLLDGLGVEVTVVYRPRDAASGPVAAPREVPSEPAGLTVVRLLAYAHEQRLIRWIDPIDPNAGYRPATVFTLGYGRGRVRVASTAVQPWLIGLADAAAPEMADLLAET
jgi:hypothetical protein